MQISDEQREGTIFNIQKYSVHDGPGIRTVVFLKGCPLRCEWCSNPESQTFMPELACNAGKCMGIEKCQRCLEVCPEGAINQESDESKVFINRKLCKGCLEICTDACVAKALISYGRKATVAEIIKDVETDVIFYKRSGGGVTFSGGEPLAQPEFILALLREARKHRIKTSIETCGMVEDKVLLDAAQHLNHIMYDLKHHDPELHQKATGFDNTIILENFSRLVEEYPTLPILVRTPVIPGFNDSLDCIRSLASLVKEKQKINPHLRYELLPYHRLGTQKYIFLDRQVPLEGVRLDNHVFAQLQHEAVVVLAG